MKTLILFASKYDAELDNIVELDNLENLLGKKTYKKIKFVYSDREDSKTKIVSLGEEFGNN